MSSSYHFVSASAEPRSLSVCYASMLHYFLDTLSWLIVGNTLSCDNFTKKSSLLRLYGDSLQSSSLATIGCSIKYVLWLTSFYVMIIVRINGMYAESILLRYQLHLGFLIGTYFIFKRHHKAHDLSV